MSIKRVIILGLREKYFNLADCYYIDGLYISKVLVDEINKVQIIIPNRPIDGNGLTRNDIIIYHDERIKNYEEFIKDCYEGFCDNGLFIMHSSVNLVRTDAGRYKAI